MVLAVVVVGTGLVVTTIGGRRVDREVDRIRKMAATGTTVSPDALVFSAMSGAPDPVAGALATDAHVDAFQLRDQTWCVELTVSRLLSRRTIALSLGLDGRLTDVPSCART